MTVFGEFRLKLYPKDYSGVKDFYAQIIGLKIISEWNRGAYDQGVMFQAGQAVLELLTSARKIKEVKGADISLEVGRLSDWWTRLKDKVTIVFPPRENSWGDRSFCISDPEGFEITFFEKI